MASLLRALPFRRAACAAPSLARLSSVRHFTSYPSDRKYNSSHEWAKVDGDVATIGITRHAQAALGDIVFADLPEIGSKAEAGERAATVESVKASAEIYAPIAGEVVQVNSKLEEAPELINSEPHEEGWIFQVKLSDPTQMDTLMNSQDYEKSIEDA